MNEGLVKTFRDSWSTDWSTRDGLFDALCLVVETLGGAWARRYECELLSVVLFSVKSAPREISIAGAKSFRFMMKLCSSLYGSPHFVDVPSQSKPFMFDLLSPWKKKEIVSEESKATDDELAPSKAETVSCPCDDVLQILISEMASTKYMAR